MRKALPFFWQSVPSYALRGPIRWSALLDEWDNRALLTIALIYIYITAQTRSVRSVISTQTYPNYEIRSDIWNKIQHLIECQFRSPYDNGKLTDIHGTTTWQHYTRLKILAARKNFIQDVRIQSKRKKRAAYLLFNLANEGRHYPSPAGTLLFGWRRLRGWGVVDDGNGYVDDDDLWVKRRVVLGAVDVVSDAAESDVGHDGCKEERCECEKKIWRGNKFTQCMHLFVNRHNCIDIGYEGTK